MQAPERGVHCAPLHSGQVLMRGVPVLCAGGMGLPPALKQGSYPHVVVSSSSETSLEPAAEGS
jgi:hypothetical protein